MELGPYQLQIFTSIVVILGAAFVALICDFLKGNNEQLRELTIELKVRREEEQRRFQMLMPQALAAGTAGAAVAIPAPAARIAVEKPAEPAAVAAAKPRESQSASVSRPVAREKRTPSAEALAAMERGAALAASPHAARAARLRQAETQKASVATTVEEPVVQVVQQVAETAPAQTAAARRNWNSLLDSARNAPPKREAALLEAVVEETASHNTTPAGEPALPSGFQDGFVLSQLVQTHQPISGLVMSIGVSAPKESDGSLPAQVHGLIQTLLGAEDFACQSGTDEFLLIFPNERGASAQRRLNQVAQQLWDFQLRSLGTYSILFSWGGVEVRSESIDEAIASASERMYETKRGRKVVMMDEPREQELRQAV